MLTGEGLAVFRGERLVFRDIGFAVEAGAALVLTGPNGAGKSTLLRLIAGLIPPVAGTLCWNGTDALADPVEHARRLSYLGHENAVKPALTAAENLRFSPQRPRLGIVDALQAVGLAELADFPARFFSAGQRRRLALARLVLSSATLWLLDEPTVGLDAASVAMFGDLIAAHCARGGVLVAATHLALPLARAAELRLG